MVYSKSFGGLGELIDFVQKAKSLSHSTHSSHKPSGPWYGWASWDEAMKLAVEGWEEGTRSIEKFTSKFAGLIGSMLQIDDYYYDVTGQDFDLDRVLIGEPEAWLNTEQVEVKAPALQTLKLVVNIGASSAVTSDILTRKGAAICALVQMLERSRRRVEVVAITRDCYSFWQADSGFDFDVVLKQAGQEIDLAKMAFCLMHASFLRRVQFRVMESCWVGMPGNYGHSSDFRKPAADIYIGCSHTSNRVFESEEGTINWVIDRLKEQGVELREEVQG